MNIELTKQQADLADKILSKLCEKERMNGDVARSLSHSADEVVFLCEHLDKEGLIKIMVKTEDPIYALKATSETCSFLKNGGYTKVVNERENEKIKQAQREDKKDKILDLDLKLKTFERKIGRKIAVAGFIIVFLSFLISLFTTKYASRDESEGTGKIEMIDEIE